MSIEDLKTQKPVLAAIDEWNRLGANKFRQQDHSAAAKRYFIVVGKRRYDLKPLMAAAYRLAYPNRRAVTSREFHTHVAAAVAKRLNFEVFISPGAADAEAQRRGIAEAETFDPSSIEDSRKKILTSIVQRQGQARFRSKILKAYGGRCAVSGCTVAQVLDAAHILPYRGPDTNHVSNGILLRADLHTLFDLLLFTIDAKSSCALVSPRLQGSEYWRFHGKKIRLPVRAEFQPSKEALDEHRRQSDASGSV